MNGEPLCWKCMSTLNTQISHLDFDFKSIKTFLPKKEKYTETSSISLDNMVESEINGQCENITGTVAVIQVHLCSLQL